MAKILRAFKAAGRWVPENFDLEGLVGAVAAWLVGLLLGALWAPLFWLGFAAAVLVLLATRRRPRTLPTVGNLVVAPCDGVIMEVTQSVPPSELRLGTDMRLRVRISSSIASTNPLHAPVSGHVSSLVMEDPDPSVWMAAAPDTPGLAVAYIGLENDAEPIGFVVSTGGFGPRLELSAETGDVVALGDEIGKRRLGGWCDVYLAADARLLVREGQTLIGAETVICRLKREDNNMSAGLPKAHATVAEDTLETVGVDALDKTDDQSTVPEHTQDEAEAVDTVDQDTESPEARTVELLQKLKAEAERSASDKVV